MKSTSARARDTLASTNTARAGRIITTSTRTRRWSACNAGKTPAQRPARAHKSANGDQRGKEFAINSPEPVTAALRLLNYPAWRVEVNGKPVLAVSDQHTGQMLVSLPAGTSRVRVAFAATPDRRWGNVISAGAALALLAVLLTSRRLRWAATSGNGT